MSRPIHRLSSQGTGGDSGSHCENDKQPEKVMNNMPTTIMAEQARKQAKVVESNKWHYFLSLTNGAISPFSSTAFCMFYTQSAQITEKLNSLLSFL
jgi:hypothetical protein